MKSKVLFCGVLLFSIFLFSCFAGSEKVFKSTLSGTWYPADTGELKKQIEKMFKGGEEKKFDDIIALILPHAGYVYSGQTAVSAVKTLNKNYKTIIIIGPTHYSPMGDVFSVPKYDYYESPLGRVQFDKELIDRLLDSKIFKDIPEALEREHSVQIEVPLLQYKLKDFKIVFIIAGQCSEATIEEAGKALAQVAGDDILIVASSDFTHYGPRFGFTPFKNNVEENIKKLDMEAFEFIKKLDGNGLMEHVNKTGATICGAVPIAVLVTALPKTSVVNLIQYTDSGKITGDKTNTVSYVSAVITGKWDSETKESENISLEDDKKGQTAETAGTLSGEDKKTLLELARKTISHHLKTGKTPTPEELGVKTTKNIETERAAFVTLTKNSQLRGCIGEIFPRQPLFKSVISNAINAAVNDYRFKPLKKEEFPQIHIEISALTVPKEISSVDEIKLGRDGVVLKKHFNQAVFLPQVAPEQGWTLEQMLANLAMKAGLSADAWKEDCSFMTFQAEVFEEEK